MSTRDDYSSAYKAATRLGMAETILFALTIVLNLAATTGSQRHIVLPEHRNCDIVVHLLGFVYDRRLLCVVPS